MWVIDCEPIIKRLGDAIATAERHDEYGRAEEFKAIMNDIVSQPTIAIGKREVGTENPGDDFRFAGVVALRGEAVEILRWGDDDYSLEFNIGDWSIRGTLADILEELSITLKNYL